MINRTILVGRITKDPELKATQSNISFVNFTLAVNRQFKDDKGETQVDFIQCIVWRKQSENLARYVKKGALLGIEGRIQTRNYETEEGTRYITEVVCDTVQFLETKSDSNYPTTDEQIDETYKDNPYNPTITTPTDRRNERKKEDEFYETSKQLASQEDLPF